MSFQQSINRVKMDYMMKLMMKPTKNFSSDDDSESDISIGDVSISQQSFSPRNDDDITTKTEKKRLPTRRPDPNVYNRNALLARENRRKKKAHLANLEKELQDQRIANHHLMKVLKKQIKNARRLEREKQYYKNLVENQTEIYSLVNALNMRLPEYQQKSLVLGNFNNNNVGLRSNSISTVHSEGSFTSGSRISRNNTPLYTATDDYSDNGTSFDYGTIDLSPFNVNENGNEFANFFTDLDQPSSGHFSEPWSELLNDNLVMSSIPIEEEPSSPNKSCDNNLNNNIIEEHSYGVFKPDSNDDFLETPNNVSGGICLHIAGGKVSLEFCPTCHYNASRTPPYQLLQEVNANGTC